MDPLGSITNNGSYTTPRQITGSPAATGNSKADARAGVSSAGAVGTSIGLPADRVTLSGLQPATEENTVKSKPKPGEKTTPDDKSTEDPQVKQQTDRLKQIEEKVKSHEAAHKAAGGSLASSASYSYTQGPDGRSYITGGEVQIDLSSGRTPEETVSRMQQVIRAALAPADPSGQDRSVAAQAASQMAQAQQQKTQADTPSSEPNPGQPVDSTTTGSTTDQTSSQTSNTKVQQAYGNPAVQGNNSTTPDQSRSPGIPSTKRQSGVTETAGSLLFSAVA